MRSIDEQLAEIKLWESTRRRKKSTGRVALLSGIAGGACLLLLIATVNILPTLKMQSGGQGSVYYGTTVFGSPLAGFAVIVLLAFALGVCVTLLCVTLRRNRRDGK